jgi:hypothetical protein
LDARFPRAKRVMHAGRMRILSKQKGLLGL